MPSDTSCSDEEARSLTCYSPASDAFHPTTYSSSHRFSSMSSHLPRYGSPKINDPQFLEECSYLYRIYSVHPDSDANTSSEEESAQASAATPLEKAWSKWVANNKRQSIKLTPAPSRTLSSSPDISGDDESIEIDTDSSWSNKEKEDDEEKVKEESLYHPIQVLTPFPSTTKSWKYFFFDSNNEPYDPIHVSEKIRYNPSLLEKKLTNNATILHGCIKYFLSDLVPLLLSSRREETIATLINSPDNKGRTPLFYLLEKYGPHMRKCLRESVSFAKRKENPSFSTRQESDEETEEKAHIFEEAFKKIIIELLDKGASAGSYYYQYKHYSPLKKACLEGLMPVVTLFLKNDIHPLLLEDITFVLESFKHKAYFTSQQHSIKKVLEKKAEILSAARTISTRKGPPSPSHEHTHASLSSFKKRKQ